jgi:hypothetical protein
MQNAGRGFDVSFRDCPAKGGTCGHTSIPPSELCYQIILNFSFNFIFLCT